MYLSQEFKLTAENLDAVTLQRLGVLRKAEETCCQKLLTADHSRDSQVYLHGLPTTPFDATCLYLIRELLPWNFRMAIESMVKNKLESNDLSWRSAFLTIYDRVVLFQRPTYLNGRVLPRVSSLCKQLNIELGKKPKAVRAQRHRGYRDHGSLPEFDKQARQEANTGFKVSKEELLREYHLRVQTELERATEVLTFEKEGFSPEEIAESGRYVEAPHGARSNDPTLLASVSNEVLHRSLVALEKKEEIPEPVEALSEEEQSPPENLLDRAIWFMGGGSSFVSTDKNK